MEPWAELGLALALHGGYATRASFPFVGKRLCARNGALRAPIDDSGHARPSPLGCGRFPPYLRLVTGVRLAPPVSSLAEDTFAPAQPPFIVIELLGEKTNLTQKKPSVSET